MDKQEASCMDVVLEQFNERLDAIVDLREVETCVGPEGDVAFKIDDADGTPVAALLSVGLDIDQDDLDRMSHNLAHSTLDGIRDEIRATGGIGCSDIKNAVQQAFIAGALHERERARREA